jgi:periplasmic divalent cation tolerance protein
MADTYVQVTTTTDSRDDAKWLARDVVERRLAACAQVLGPIDSVYWWEGAVESAGEWLCLMKTTSARLDALIAHLRAGHSHDNPEITAAPISAGSTDYLAWISQETQPDAGMGASAGS